MKCIYCDRPNEGEHKDYCPARNSPLTMAESMMIMGLAREYAEKIIKGEDRMERMSERVKSGKLSSKEEIPFVQKTLLEFQ